MSFVVYRGCFQQSCGTHSARTMACSIGILIFGSPTTSFYVFRSCLFYFILFCSEPLLPRQLLLLLGALAINATKFFVSAFLVPRSHNAINLRETDTNRNKKKRGLLNCCVLKTKHMRLLQMAHSKLDLKKNSLCKTRFPFLLR